MIGRGIRSAACPHSGRGRVHRETDLGGAHDYTLPATHGGARSSRHASLRYPARKDRELPTGFRQNNDQPKTKNTPPVDSPCGLRAPGTRGAGNLRASWKPRRARQRAVQEGCRVKREIGGLELTRLEAKGETVQGGADWLARPISGEALVWAAGSAANLARIPFDASLLASEFPPPYSVATLVRALDALGLAVVAKRVGPAALSAAALPCIGPVARPGVNFRPGCGHSRRQQHRPSHLLHPRRAVAERCDAGRVRRAVLRVRRRIQAEGGGPP